MGGGGGGGGGGGWCVGWAGRGWGRVARERFVGREGELEALGEDSGAVVIAGDAGVGKSRLVAELERRAISEGKFVLVGECVELTDGELPYAAVVSALRSVLHHDLAADV